MSSDFTERSGKDSSIWQDSISRNLSRYELIAGRIWKGDILIADLEDLIKLDTWHVYLLRLNAKEVLIRQKEDEFIYPIEDGTAKFSGRDYEFREPTLSVHTPCRTHICQAHFLCVACRRRVHAWLKVFAVRMSTSLHLTFSILMFHPPSLLFPHGHFDFSFPSTLSLPNCSLIESAGFRTSGEESGYLADPTHSTGHEPKEFDKTTSAAGETTLDCSVFPQCWMLLFRTFLTVSFFLREKAKTACIGKPLLDREREKKKSLWSVLQSRCQGKVDGTVWGVILFRLTENSILMNEISEKIWNEELNKLFLVKNQFRENYIWLSTTSWSRT